MSDDKKKPGAGERNVRPSKGDFTVKPAPSKPETNVRPAAPAGQAPKPPKPKG